MTPKARSSIESGQLIAAYFREHGRMPVTGLLPTDEQKRLALALARLRSLKRRGRLPDAALRILNDASLGWAVGASVHRAEKLWRLRVDELVAWVHQHRRMPRRNAINATERALAQWVARYRSHGIHGRHRDRIKELDFRVPNWREPYHAQADRFDAVVDRYGRTRQ